MTTLKPEVARPDDDTPPATIAAAPSPARPRGRSRTASAVWWAVIAVALVGALVPLFLLAPEVGVLVVGGTVAFYAAFRWPFVMAFAALLSIIFSSILEAAGGASAGQIDEILTLLCVLAFTVRRIWVDRAIAIPAGTLFFVGFLVSGVMAALIHAVPVSVWSQQAFLSIKGILLAFAFAQLDWRTRHLRALVVGGVAVAAVLILTTAVNVIAPQAWLQFTGANIGTYLFGVLPAPNGPYPHPAALSRMCAIIGVGCLVFMLLRGVTWVPAAMLAILTGIGFLTLRVKTITSMIVVYALFSLRAKSVWVLIVAIAVLPIAAITVIPALFELVSSDLTAYFFGEEESARGSLIAGAWEIGGQYFPLGAGFGRYGSYIAAIDYSPEYTARNWTRVYGLGEGTEWGKFLTDTQWPAILGETGWLGTTLFVGGLIAMLVTLARPIMPLEPPMYTWIRWSGIGWLLLITIESIGAPVFTSPPGFPFAFIGAGIVASLRFQARRRAVTPLEEY